MVWSDELGRDVVWSALLGRECNGCRFLHKVGALPLCGEHRRSQLKGECLFPDCELPGAIQPYGLCPRHWKEDEEANGSGYLYELPIPTAADQAIGGWPNCANPVCKAAGVENYEAIGGRPTCANPACQAGKCSGCRNTRYCNRACREADWAAYKANRRANRANVRACATNQGLPELAT